MALGISALVLGFCCAVFGVPLAIAAVITGIIGLVQLKENPRQAGKGQAIAGISCGAAGLVAPFLFLAFSIGGAGLSSFGR